MSASPEASAGPGRAPPFPWTDPATERLHELWKQGATATAIAVDLSGRMGIPVTRNAVIGKANRSGLTRANKGVPPQARPTVAAPSSSDSAPSVAIAPAAPPAPAEPAPLEPETGREHYRLLDLRRRQCRYPTKFDAKGMQLFCGEPAPDGCSWCSEHQAVVFERRPGDVRSGERALQVLKRRAG